MPSDLARGTLCLVLSGVLDTASLVVSGIMEEQNWPYFRIFGLACLLISLGTLVAMALLNISLPDASERKWLLLRGSFGALTFLLLVAAVHQGTPMGDVATLQSVNMVVAALLGRVVLSEPLRCPHLLALLSSLSGAVLIARPSFLFPSEEPREGWLGYLLAPASGFSQACVFIASRKAPGSSAWLHLLSVMVQCAVAGLLLPLIVPDASLAPVRQAPLMALAWLSVVTGLIFVPSLSTSAAGRWCPAAVSAMTTTGVRMACSYAAQTVLFGEALEPLTIVGAALMLVAVVVVATLKTEARTGPLEQAGAVDEAATVAVSEEAETESLASFIAAEFVDFSPKETAVRQRRGAGEQPTVAAPSVLAAAVSVGL